MKKKLLFFALCLFLIACGGSTETKRDRDPWVFRSVLDNRPRMITLALHKKLWVSYSTQSGLLYKAWRGGANFDGAVYTSSHGPQPTSKGAPFLVDSTATMQWLVLQNGKENPAKLRYKGHIFTEKGKNVALHYEIVLPDGKIVDIKEFPDYIEKDKKIGFQRVFETANVPEGTQIALKTNLASLTNAEDYEVEDGTFAVKNTQKDKYSFGETFRIDGTLSLKSNGKTTFSCFVDGRVAGE